MYAGTTFRCHSGRVVGVHQKVDRIARRNLNSLIKKSAFFPGIMTILKFEGQNGPDGLKVKRSKTDVPFHFIDPDNPNDRILLDTVDDHLYNLAKALQARDNIRSAFEAAWLAHAITDGLTPPHYYPYAEKIVELFGKPRSEMRSMKERMIIKGSNRRDTLSKNWQYWGTSGVSSNHLLFEFGVAIFASRGKFENCGPTEKDLIFINKHGYEKFFKHSIKKIYKLGMYDTDDFSWTTGLDSVTKTTLIPEIIKNITAAWYYASVLAGKI